MFEFAFFFFTHKLSLSCTFPIIPFNSLQWMDTNYMASGHRLSVWVPIVAVITTTYSKRARMFPVEDEVRMCSEIKHNITLTLWLTLCLNVASSPASHSCLHYCCSQPKTVNTKLEKGSFIQLFLNMACNIYLWADSFCIFHSLYWEGFVWAQCPLFCI